MKWHNRFIRYPELWLLSLGALVTRFWQLGQPGGLVFDEVYFREFASNYLTGAYFFDIHPPLIKLLLAGVGGLFGLSPDQIASGEESAVVMRLLPALAGALIVPLVYVIIRQLGLGRRIAVLGGALVLLDNALLVESRFVLMDSMLLLLGLGAVSCYLAMRKAKGLHRWRWLIALAVTAGMVASTKWSGLAVVFVLSLAWLVEGVMRRMSWRNMLIETGAILGIMVTVYLSAFALHFALLTHSGEGDVFMSRDFQSTLLDAPNYDSNAQVSFWQKFGELNHEMYASQSSLEAIEHPYASKWNSWPLMVRTVYYWQGQADVSGAQGHIYLLGNPIIWWGSAFAVIGAIVLYVFRAKLIAKRSHLLLFLLAGYIINWLPFAFINRPMFLYHYFFALLFAILIVCVLASVCLDVFAQKYGRKAAMRVYWGAIIAVGCAFVYFLPVSYGWSLTEADLQRYMWLPSWR